MKMAGWEPEFWRECQEHSDKGRGNRLGIAMVPGSQRPEWQPTRLHFASHEYSYSTFFCYPPRRCDMRSCRWGIFFFVTFVVLSQAQQKPESSKPAKPNPQSSATTTPHVCPSNGWCFTRMESATSSTLRCCVETKNWPLISLPPNSTTFSSR